MVKNFSNVLALLELPWYVDSRALFGVCIERHGLGASPYVYCIFPTSLADLPPGRSDHHSMSRFAHSIHVTYCRQTVSDGIVRL